MKTLSKKFNDWMAAPMGTANPQWPALLAVLFLSFLSWTHLDTDSFYMIAQGRDILANGIPRMNGFNYYPDAAIVVQQWPYCVAEYLASLVPGNVGLWLFMMVQAMALYLLFRHVTGMHTGDRWIATGTAIVSCVVPIMPYFYSCRPENLTLIILLLEALALEKYRATKNSRWLIALPLLMVAEINLHGSMWPFHFCILAAYVVPPVLKDHMRDNHVRLDWNVFLAGISMFPAMLLNPYGIDMPLYVLRSLDVFKYIPIVEQAKTDIASVYGLQVVICMAFLMIMVAKKKASSVTSYIAAGFLLLGSAQYHSCMFLPFIYLWLCRDALDWFEGQDPARVEKIAPNALKAAWWCLALVAAAVAIPAAATNLPKITENPSMDDAIRYVSDHQQPGENVLNMLNTGSAMEYAGITGIQSDTRPELQLKSINGAVDAHLEHRWLCTGIRPNEDRPEYESIGAYLDYYNIQYIVDQVDAPSFRYLAGWLSNSPDWVLADIGAADSACTFNVWIRTGNTR